MHVNMFRNLQHASILIWLNKSQVLLGGRTLLMLQMSSFRKSKNGTICWWAQPVMDVSICVNPHWLHQSHCKTSSLMPVECATHSISGIHCCLGELEREPIKKRVCQRVRKNCTHLNIYMYGKSFLKVVDSVYLQLTRFVVVLQLARVLSGIYLLGLAYTVLHWNI